MPLRLVDQRHLVSCCGRCRCSLFNVFSRQASSSWLSTCSLPRAAISTTFQARASFFFRRFYNHLSRYCIRGAYRVRFHWGVSHDPRHDGHRSWHFLRSHSCAPPCFPIEIPASEPLTSRPRTRPKRHQLIRPVASLQCATASHGLQLAGKPCMSSMSSWNRWFPDRCLQLSKEWHHPCELHELQVSQAFLRERFIDTNRRLLARPYTCPAPHTLSKPSAACCSLMRMAFRSRVLLVPFG